MSDSTYDDVLIRRSLSPAARTASANGVAVDLGANGGTQTASVCVLTGAITDGTHAISVEESDDGSTGWAAVDSSQVQGTAPSVGEDDDDTQFEFGIRTDKRYIRVVATVSGTTTGGIYGAVVALGKCRQKPVSHS